MKRCPTCARTYDGAERFCREDGAPLVVGEVAAAASPAADSAEPGHPTLPQADAVLPQTQVPASAEAGPSAPAPAVQAPTAVAAASAAVDPDAVATVVGPVPQPGPGDAGAIRPAETAAGRTPPPFPVAPGLAQTTRPGAPPPLPPLQMPARPRPVPGSAAAGPYQPPGAPVRPSQPRPVESSIAETPTLLTSMPDDGDEVQSAYVGKLIDDRYLVQALIGHGGMGAVFRCEQIHLKKIMAIKLLHENLVSKKQLIARFTREARAISRLSSPHTVMVYDFGRFSELFYLVMELIEGEPLDMMLDREGPLQADRAARIVLQMCDSLAEAHRHGIIHRDLKPENVMLLSHGAHPDFVKILDFGLAKVQGVDDPYTIHSQRDIFGTPFYMSPEQIRAGDIDGRADVYAVGALMFRMLTGHHVFAQKNTFDILKAHLMEAPPRMNDLVPEQRIPEVLEAIVAKALQKDPNLRFSSMDELADALVAAVKGNFRETALSALPASSVDRRGAAQGMIAAPAAPPAVAAALPAPAPPLPEPVVVLPTRSTDIYEAEQILATAPRKQQRKAWLFFSMVVGLAVVFGAAVWLSGGPSPREAEPNDDVAHANQLGPGDQVRGVIGRRRSAQAADQDCFVLPRVAADQELAVLVAGVPNMDLQLSLHKDADKALLTMSHRGKGQGELLRLPDPALDARVVCVTETLSSGQVPGESLSDQYTLTATTRPRSPHSEREPNDEQPGNDIQLGIAWTAALDGPTDRDVFALPGNVDNQLLQVELELPPNQEGAYLRMALLDGSRRMLAARRVLPGEVKPVLAFVGATRQMPDAVAVQRLAPKGGELRPEEVPYTLQYRIIAAADQPEAEPNNTEESAQPMVLGAWHNGDTGDSAATDWLRVDGGDPAMQQLRIEALATSGQFTLMIRDLGSRADLRQIPITDAAVRETIINNGTGEGFLLRVTSLEGPGKRKEAARWRLRARVSSNN